MHDTECSIFQSLVSVEYQFSAIPHKYMLGSVYESNWSIRKLLVLDENTWDNITVCKLFVGLLVLFYDISTLIGYSMLNPVYTHTYTYIFIVNK